MDQNWTFSALPYQRPDYDAIQAKLDELTEAIRTAPDFETVETAIYRRDALLSQRGNAELICFARSFHDVTDPYYQQEQAYIDAHAPLLREEALCDAICRSPFRPQIDAAFGPQFCIRLEAEARVSARGKELRAREQTLVSRYQQTKAQLRYDLRGEQISEGKLRQALTSPDRSLRQEAYQARERTILAHREELGDLLRQLVETRTQLAQANGFDSYLDYIHLAQGRLDYGQQELASFAQAVRTHIVPLYKANQEAQRRRLGVEVLRPYDRPLLFPEGNAKPVEGEAALAQAAREMYHSLSPEAGRFFDEMVDRELLDVSGSDRKISGMGFCSFMGSPYQMPYIFANSNGTATDVTVYTHELGHALQGYLSLRSLKLDSAINAGPDYHEIHSKTMELLSYPYAPLFFGADAPRFLAEHRAGIVKELCAYTQMFAFESWLYAHPQATLEEWAHAYVETELAYGLASETDDLTAARAGAALLQDMAIFSFPLYVLSYALSQVCALELKAGYDRDPISGWARYRAICSCGGSVSYAQALRSVGLDLPYEEEAVKKAAAALAEQ